MLILHSDLKRTTIETLQAKFRRSKSSALAGKWRKWQFLSQNGTLGHFDPAKWYFCAEFSSWSIVGNNRDFLSQVRSIKTFSSHRARLWKGPILQYFIQNRKFGHFDPLNGFFMLISRLGLKMTIDDEDGFISDLKHFISAKNTQKLAFYAQTLILPPQQRHFKTSKIILKYLGHKSP